MFRPGVCERLEELNSLPSVTAGVLLIQSKFYIPHALLLGDAGCLRALKLVLILVLVALK